jgi:pimeloyl-ACP methyl ester carboxylesterase
MHMADAVKVNRRRFCGTAAAAIAVTQFPLFADGQSSGYATNGIHPFKIRVPQAQLADLRRRIHATRWPERETVADETQGVQLATIRELARYWATAYDWRRVERKLNSMPQFITQIDGLDVHFIHVRSKHPNALPIIITHGWPGSVVEQLKIIEPLANPTAYGGSASDAFHVVVPSVPGYGFSGKPPVAGWGAARIATAWVSLMKRLGYRQFVAQGGDIGSVISTAMALQAPPELLAIHTNLPGTVPPDVAKAIAMGAPAPADLSADEKRAYDEVVDFRSKHFAYALEMTLRPQTLYALTDSPVALAAWLFDHGDGWGQPAATIASAVAGRTIDGHSAGAVTRDDVLDNITLYWLTATGISAARFYWENKGMSPINAVAVNIPVALSIFPGELYQAPRSWAQKTFPKLIHYNQLDKGGHFAAWEQPQIFSEELRASFRTLRKSVAGANA